MAMTGLAGTDAPQGESTQGESTHYADMSPEMKARARRAIAASSVGNALEWFDIIVYASFAPIISKLFFPPATAGQGDIYGLLVTYGLFAISYLIRPLGAMVLGSYADRHGRKKALSLTIFTMLVGTAVMAFAPTAAMVGPAAGLFILVSRLLQGFSAGGEFGSSTAYLVEHSRDEKAFFGSFQVATQGAALLMAAAFGWIVNTQLSAEQIASWGWRLPFFFGLLIGPVGFYIRARMDETPEFDAVGQPESSPLLQTLTRHAPRWLAAAGCMGLATLSVYLILYLPAYAVRSLKLPAHAGFYGGMISGVVTMFGSPWAGRLADRFGCARVMTWAAVIGVVVVIPLFQALIASPSMELLTIVQIVLGALMAMYFAPLPALMSQLFPVAIRATGLSVGYNLGVTLFGGFAPLIFAWLETMTASGMGPPYYYVAVGLLSLASLFVVRRRFGMR